MARVFSGVQPTGEGPHIGNYIGAFRRWVELQDTQDECFYCIVDLHAMTAPWEPKTLAEGVRRTAATLIATGIDPERSVLFVQSDVAEPLIGTQGARIMSLDDPTEKMSKSSVRPASTIGMLDDLTSVRRKTVRAVTDSGSTVAYGPDRPAVSNLLDILAGVTGESIP